jgi:hypothetical protein
MNLFEIFVCIGFCFFSWQLDRIRDAISASRKESLPLKEVKKHKVNVRIRDRVKEKTATQVQDGEAVNEEFA